MLKDTYRILSQDKAGCIGSKSVSMVLWEELEWSSKLFFTCS